MNKTKLNQFQLRAGLDAAGFAIPEHSLEAITYLKGSPGISFRQLRGERYGDEFSGGHLEVNASRGSRGRRSSFASLRIVFTDKQDAASTLAKAVAALLPKLTEFAAQVDARESRTLRERAALAAYRAGLSRFTGLPTEGVSILHSGDSVTGETRPTGISITLRITGTPEEVARKYAAVLAIKLPLNIA